ncbi:protein phosphatase 2C [Xylona heveae TC161]|uniref:Protein phosphatase 2C n=1 Tax=Xylona heveae (strain CBS 132557 / TC161) TaxID=1328760 RepID=A0A165HVX3_XYLHT|nr:protein phosphatase 2C [Xylona heveae TC161]KZF23995.1 protein phosphatase 2C [Xylona heveae TC161]
MVRIRPCGLSLSAIGRGWTLGDTYEFIGAYAGLSRSRKLKGPSLSHPKCESQRRCYRPKPSQGHRSLSPNQALKGRSGVRSDECSHSRHGQRKGFHDYFVTHLPSSSMHPDSRPPAALHHKLPRSASTPHTPGPGPGPAPAAAAPAIGLAREMTVVRIPLRSAKHHFGASVSRGTRPYNEDTYQAGVIDIPAFAKRQPLSVTLARNRATPGEGVGAETASGDPQVFYYGVFDGHGGKECSEFLRDSLHSYIEETARLFRLESSLRPTSTANAETMSVTMSASTSYSDGQLLSTAGSSSSVTHHSSGTAKPPNVLSLQRAMVHQWKETVGGYFRRFKPQYFSPLSNTKRYSVDDATDDSTAIGQAAAGELDVGIETVLMYAFLKADLDFILAQARKADEDNIFLERALNEAEVLGEPGKSRLEIGGPTRFKGGSTGSVAMISTPTPTPFWHPRSSSTLLTAHVGDCRILLCATESGAAVPMTIDHHPASPGEGARLRRYAATFVTDSFGEERISGLANTRSFGDMQSKRIGVSAEPEVRRLEMGPAEYSFLVLMSDGISGELSDQEIVDIIKEAKTPDQGAASVVSFATEVGEVGDNATCIVIRLGGWERRSEGGMGSMSTRELREWRRQEATDPRRRRT